MNISNDGFAVVIDWNVNGTKLGVCANDKSCRNNAFINVTLGFRSNPESVSQLSICPEHLGAFIIDMNETVIDTLAEALVERLQFKAN